MLILNFSGRDVAQFVSAIAARVGMDDQHAVLVPETRIDPQAPLAGQVLRVAQEVYVKAARKYLIVVLPPQSEVAVLLLESLTRTLGYRPGIARIGDIGNGEQLIEVV